MAEQKESSNVNCPKHYGIVRWVIPSSSGGWCPVSGHQNCTECRVITSNELGDDRQVKVKEKK